MIGKPSELIYKVLLCIVTLDAALYSTTISETIKGPLHQLCLAGTLLLAVVCMLVRRYTTKQFIISMSVLAFGIISYVISGNTDIFISVLIVMLAWKVDINDILKTIFCVRLSAFIFTVVMSLAGILEIGTIALSSADKGVMFGYGHANTFAGNAGILIFLMFAIYRKNLKRIHFTIALMADFLIFYFSRSRTSLILLTALIIMVAFCLKKKRAEVIFKIGKIFLPILLIFVLGLVFLRAKGMCPRFIDIADWLLNGRILLAVMNLTYYPITLLGQRVDLSTIAAHHTYYALDNGYIYVLIHYGIVGLFVICGLAQKAILECIYKKDAVLCVISMLILCWMVYEGMMISATSNFTLLFSVALINVNNIRFQKCKRRKLNDT